MVSQSFVYGCNLLLNSMSCHAEELHSHAGSELFHRIGNVHGNVVVQVSESVSYNDLISNNPMKLSSLSPSCSSRGLQHCCALRGPQLSRVHHGGPRCFLTSLNVRRTSRSHVFRLRATQTEMKVTDQAEITGMSEALCPQFDCEIATVGIPLDALDCTT